MRKVVKFSLVVLLICAQARPRVPPRTAPDQTAQEEAAVRRQDAIIQLGTSGSKRPRPPRRKGRVPDASKAYEAAIALFPRLGSRRDEKVVDAERAAVVAGFVKIRISSRASQAQ